MFRTLQFPELENANSFCNGPFVYACGPNIAGYGKAWVLE